MIKTLVIEDERPAARRLALLLKKLLPDIEISAYTDTVESSVQWLRTNPAPDLIMLDIQLGDGLCFEIFRKVRVESYVIFTTAYDEYAIRAFELNSIDYLLKPVDEDRLSQSLDKFKRLHSGRQFPDFGELLRSIEKKDSRYRKRFAVTIADRIRVIETDDIAFFYSRDKSSYLCTGDNKHYPLEYSLDNIETMLDPIQFFRVNRQYLVKYSSISRITILSRSRIRIETNPPPESEILVSSARSSEFRSWLEK